MFLQTREKQVALVNLLKDCDCCSKCILRYLGVKLSDGSDTYLNPDEVLMELMYTKDENIEEPSKRVKKNSCRACLNILEESTIERYVANINEADAKNYNYMDFVQSVNVPKSLLVREHSMLLYIKENFPDYSNVTNVQSVKQVFRLIAGELLSKKIKKLSRLDSSFSVIVDILYEDDDKEVENIKHINKKKIQNTSKNTISTALTECDIKSFKAYFCVPPDVPLKETTANISFNSGVIYLGGRYLKFSRNMGQTPWIVNNKALTEYCLMDILFDSIIKVLGYDRKKLTFSSSGREDSDVRMVGDGRPFYIQIEDPKDPTITFEQCRAIEEDIIKSKLVAVIKLQKVENVDVHLIKTGELSKIKHYTALCYITTPTVQWVVNQINNYKNISIEIDQKTPLRVLHRRTLSTRKKTIYSMEASAVPERNNLFYVQMVTQAGTYVKEFVHGDFHRTEPSLTSLVGQQVDVVALDVNKIDLEWPLKNK